MPKLPEKYTAEEQPAEFERLPEGTYGLEITGSEIMLTKSGHNALRFSFEVIHPSAHIGRRVTDLLNLWHSNDKSREVAVSTLSRIAIAAGMQPGATLSDTDVLDGCVVEADVVHTGNGGKTYANLRRYRPYEGKVATRRRRPAPRAAAAEPDVAGQAGDDGDGAPEGGEFDDNIPF